MSTTNLEQIARETAEKCASAFYESADRSHFVEIETRIILAALRQVAPQPAKEEVRRVVEPAIKDNPEWEALALARTAIERSLESAPGFDGYYTPHRDALAAIKALGIEAKKIKQPDL